MIVLGQNRINKKTSSPTSDKRRNTTSPSRLGFLIDAPHYCPKCGSQYYVSGGEVDWGGRRRRIYEVSGPLDSDIFTFPKKPLCPSCLVELVDISYIEEVFGDEIRSF